jgi:hypothetical protein
MVGCSAGVAARLAGCPDYCETNAAVDEPGIDAVG